MKSLLLCALLLSTLGIARSAPYDPLQPVHAGAATVQDLTVVDGKRSREIPIRVHLPAAPGSAPLVVFSHGLGGSRNNAAYLAKHWTGRGYAVVVVQHPGSDEGVWRGVPAAKRGAALGEAASGENLRLRMADVPAVLDQLTAWNGEAKHPLQGRLDLQRVGMSGHSFGAVTTQALSGQRMPGAPAGPREPRIRAAVVMSPSVPRLGDAAEAFGGVTLPWLCLTGTKDVARIGGRTLGASDVESRLGVFPALPPGDKYEVVLKDAEHSAFSDAGLRLREGERNPNHHRVILALTTAFWDAYLKGSAEAKAWLKGLGPRGVMEPEDRWQTK